MGAGRSADLSLHQRDPRASELLHERVFELGLDSIKIPDFHAASRLCERRAAEVARYTRWQKNS